MKYIYESIQPGLFNFTIPGEDKTVHLFLGSKVTVSQKLTGGYLRVLKLISEIDDEVITDPIQPKAKIEDKITKVEEIVEEISVTTNDSIINVEEDVTPKVEVTPKSKSKKIKK